MALSLRLKTIASLVPNGARVCDIGTDHALLPIFLIKEKIAKSVIATDIRPLPLENARKNILDAGISSIETRLCDGLCGVNENEADTIIIAGMGGEVISGIIERAEWLKNKTAPMLILQPTTSPEYLRQFLNNNGFEIKTDTALSDNDKLYSVMTVFYTGNTESLEEYLYYIGRTNPNATDGRLYIEKQYNRLNKTALSLKDIPEKQQEYLHYKKLSENIFKLLKEE